LSAFIENKNLERQRETERLERQREQLERQREQPERQRYRATGETEREQLQLRLLNQEGLLNMRGAFGKNGFSGG